VFEKQMLSSNFALFLSKSRFCHRAQLIGIAACICSVLALTPTAHGQEADERQAAGGMPEQCRKLRQEGAVIQQSSYSKSVNPGSGVTLSTTPRPGSMLAPRSYGQGGINNLFLDSFPAFPKQGCRVCGVEVQVSGVVNPGSQNNDGIAVVGSRNPGLQNALAPSYSWNFPVLGGASLSAVSGAFTKTISITGLNWSSWLMAAPNPSLDISVQDDTTVNAIKVTYYTY
jgi:hypothetical protein